ncbi:hypothetical protein F4806DRAFT_429509 [Annulohypoxylon nitens]|nr:hypothetical protein F4806DRAFT_429509 [Annulohypoxylon nitens]
MAGVGEASAFAGLLSLGIQVTTALYAVADGIGSAGEEVRNVARDVDSATQIMRTIQSVLDKQPQINDEINAIINRIMDICHQIFRIYDVLQKSLVPLMERFRDSERKLEQFGLRLKWYFRSKEKVTSCRNSLQQQIAMLTPILTLLSIDQSRTAQNNHYVQNIQLKYILENSTANLRHGFGDERRREISLDPSHSALPPSDRDTSRGRLESRSSSADVEASNGETAIIRYSSSSGINESLSQEEAEVISQQIDEELDIGLDVVTSQDIEYVLIETYSVEMQFSGMVQRILVDLENKNDRSPSPVHIIRPEPSDPEPEKKWSRINLPDGTWSLMPPDAIDTPWKLMLVLDDLGFNIASAAEDHPGLTDEEISYKLHFEPDNLKIRHGFLQQVLEANHIRMIANDDSIVIPRLWARYSVRPLTISLTSTLPVPKKQSPILKTGTLFKRLKRIVGD